VSDYLRLLYSRVGTMHCPVCGRAIVPDSPGAIVSESAAWSEGAEVRVLAPIAMPERLPWAEVARACSPTAIFGSRLPQKDRAPGTLADLEPLPKLPRGMKKVHVVIDRMKWKPGNERRLAEALEAAFARGEGRLLLQVGDDAPPVPRSERRECPVDDLSFPRSQPEPLLLQLALRRVPRPARASATCSSSIPAKVVPDARRTLKEGAIDPWAGSWRRALREEALRPVEAPRRAAGRARGASSRPAHKSLVLEGAPGFRGVMPFLVRLKERRTRRRTASSSSATSGPVRCPDCHGARVRKEALLVSSRARTSPSCSALTLGELLVFVEGLGGALTPMQQEIAASIFSELVVRDCATWCASTWRTSRSIGSRARSRAARRSGSSCPTRLGANLVDTLYVLDEPTVGLHPRDSDRLCGVLEDLARRGNTLVVVEHDPLLIGRADWVVDLGPGAGTLGGGLLWSGPGKDLAASDTSTARYMRGEERVTRTRRAIGEAPRSSSSRTRGRTT
jgi:excinuclease ABC subunit A